MELNCWAVVGLGLADDDDVINKDFGIGGLGDEDVGGKQVAGVEFAEDAGVTEFVGHGHRFHEAGDGLMIERDFAFGGVGGDDFSAQGVGLELLGRGWDFGFMAADGGDW